MTPKQRRTAATFITLLLAWEVVPRAFALPAWLLPPPSVVVQALSRQWPRVLAATWLTTEVMLGGFILALAVGVPLALLIASSRRVEQALSPVLLTLQLIPKIAVAPLFVVWFGFGYGPKTALVFLLTLFPIIISGITAFRSLDPDVLDLVRTTGAGRLAELRYVRLPAALPQLFTGVKVAAALASTGALGAEFIVSDKGLGFLMIEWRGELNTAMVFAAIMIISVIGSLLYYGVAGMEQVCLPWHRQIR